MTRDIFSTRAKVTYSSRATKILLLCRVWITLFSSPSQPLDLFNCARAHPYPLVILRSSGKLKHYFHSLEIHDAADYLDDLLLQRVN
jgi:hypothetical protein